MTEPKPKPKPWRGVRWFTAPRGRCSKHDVKVARFSGLCVLCHREQLDAAARGSSEWQLAPNQKYPTKYAGTPA